MTTTSGLVELACGEAVVRIEPAAGGRIVSLIVGGVERILPRARARATTPPIYWGCYPMVPWPGRLAEGRIPTDDGEVRLEPNLAPAAIHGPGDIEGARVTYELEEGGHCGELPHIGEVGDPTQDEDQIDRPLADDLVGDVDVAAPRVLGPREHCGQASLESAPRTGPAGPGDRSAALRTPVPP